MASGVALQIPEELRVDLESVRTTCRTFIQDQFESIGAKVAILGLSGGIDSALVGFLTADALGSDRLRTYILPYRTSAPTSRADALAVASVLGCSVEEIEISSALDAVKNGVNTCHIIDGRVEHALLLEVLTSEGVGTLIKSR